MASKGAGKPAAAKGGAKTAKSKKPAAKKATPANRKAKPAAKKAKPAAKKTKPVAKKTAGTRTLAEIGRKAAEEAVRDGRVRKPKSEDHRKGWAGGSK